MEVVNKKVSDHGMKPKTISKIIKNKMETWIASFSADLTDEQKADEAFMTEHKAFKERVRTGYIVTGGAIASMLMGELPNDYDVYFSNLDVASEVAKFYVNKMDKKNEDSSSLPVEIYPREDKTGVVIKVKSAGVVTDGEQTYNPFDTEAIENNFEKIFKIPRKNDTRKYYPLLITSNAITLSDEVQVIIRFVGSPEEIHKNYDFVHVTNYYTYVGGLVLNKESLISIMSKELNYVGSLYPLCSMFRLRKFIKRGWSVTAGEMLKIGWDINKLDLRDMNVLKEQLVGVDAAYFNELISRLEEGVKQGDPIDRTYIVTLIDSIFDDCDPPSYGIDEE